MWAAANHMALGEEGGEIAAEFEFESFLSPHTPTQHMKRLVLKFCANRSHRSPWPKGNIPKKIWERDITADLTNSE